MKKIVAAALAAMLAVLVLTACGNQVFGLSENTPKRMTLTAERAEKNLFFMVGSLEVDEGEQIVISSALTKGSIRVEIVRADAEQSIDKLPETDGEAVITANLSGTEGASGTVPAGSYLLRAVCLEKATGTVQIEVKPA